MNGDSGTQRQSTEQIHQSQRLSLERVRPPADIAGYDARQFLGAGAYGEVWVAVDGNTGRKVAIKFFTHPTAVDWALLSHEVEKLVFLSADRYVVQLLDVGWDAEPPYYVMEYIENGSLEHHLQQRGPLPLGEAVEIFRELCQGLLHAHGRGVLHCDLKPANILLDQDRKPRLADFGQSRLTHEQTPALGTLFYMAPEQADLGAVPDASWDVYALGAVLYTMLTGRPPHRDDTGVAAIESEQPLDERLGRYRTLLATAPAPAQHRRVAGMDRLLAQILDRCLAVDPQQRYPNVQSVVDALEARDAARDRRPLLMLGFLGPILFLLISAWFAWRGYQQSVRTSDQLLLHRAQEANEFAARFVAEAVARRIDGYFRAVEQVSSQEPFLQTLQGLLGHPEIQSLLDRLATEQLATSPDVQKLRRRFQEHPARQRLQAYIEQIMQSDDQPGELASWFVTDRHGVQLAAAFDTIPEENTIGGNYSFRTYFHGGPQDLAPSVPPQAHIQNTHLSTVFQSTATGAWKVAVSTPVMRDQEFLGIVALTVELGRFGNIVEGDKFTVLVDGRAGSNYGTILQHPLYTQLLRERGVLPDELSSDPRFRVPLDRLAKDQLYADRMGLDESGESYRCDWIAAMHEIRLEPRPAAKDNGHQGDTGLVVLVQEKYDQAAEPVHHLGRSLVRQGYIALAVVVCVIIVLWYFVVRALGDPNEAARRGRGRPKSPVSPQTMPTVELPDALKAQHRSREAG